MLLELKVKNLGIIEDIEWNLDSGLNVVTGETGAGKSLVIDAVELLLYGISNEDMIRTGASEARVEGIFTLSAADKHQSLKTFLEEKNLGMDEETLIINCEIRRGKPMICRINGSIITKSILRKIGQLLIDIHGQSEHLSLLEKHNHLELVDEYAGTIEKRLLFTAQLNRLNGLQNDLDRLKGREQDITRQSDFLKYQIDEIKKTELKTNEDEDLEKERHIISFSEKLKEYSGRIYEILYEGINRGRSNSSLAELNQAVDIMRKLVEQDASMSRQLEELEKTIYTIEETARDIRNYYDNLEFDPQRLDEIETRLEVIRSLKRKYGKTIPDVLSYLEKAEEELASLEKSSETLSILEKDILEMKSKLGQTAGELSRERTQAAAKLAEAMNNELRDLEMGQMQFAVNINQTFSTDGIPFNQQIYEYNNEGIDNIEFFVSTNIGEPLKPLAKIASTGEISRFTLALKSALSEADKIPVLIFDEVDIGIGGRSGNILGKKLWSLARNHQVICVTHLPQIAMYADAHYCVRKNKNGDRTISTLENLDGMFRIHELAVMLTGPELSKTAMQNAQELKQKAEEWIKTHNN